VVNLELSWPAAAVSAGVLAAGAVAARRARSRRVATAAGFAREAAVLLGLFALWQLAGSYAVMGPDGALGRARWIWHAERAVHLPSEATVQRGFLGHPLAVEGLNLYYAGLHFAVVIGCLAWVFIWHRRRYPAVRTTLVLFTAGALLVQLVPVAPPRMLPGDGMVDTAARYGQSVYGSVAGFNADQLSAMPSVHVGWALLVALVVIGVARSRWRWLALAYPAVTLLAVVVTANHFWLDGLAAALLLALALVMQRAGRAIRRRLAARWRARPARGRAARPGYLPERPSVDACASRPAFRPALSSTLACCASWSTYSWPDSAMIAYMISSVTARSTSRSASSPA
jgi:PAP2 superfamily